MTCYWSGILNGLNGTDFERICRKSPSCEKLIRFLQQYNTKEHQITWNGYHLTSQEKEENYMAVRDYNIQGFRGGHLCSPCDYFLFLVAEVFQTNIDHYYLGRLMTYRNPIAKTKLTFRYLTYFSTFIALPFNFIMLSY